MGSMASSALEELTCCAYFRVTLAHFACRALIEMLDDVLRQVRGICADPGEQGRSARPLTASTNEVQVRDGGNPTLVEEITVRVLGLGNRHPVGVVSVTGRPEHRIHFCHLSIGEGDSLPFRLNHTTCHGHTSSL